MIYPSNSFFGLTSSGLTLTAIAHRTPYIIGVAWWLRATPII